MVKSRFILKTKESEKPIAGAIKKASAPRQNPRERERDDDDEEERETDDDDDERQTTTRETDERERSERGVLIL